MIMEVGFFMLINISADINENLKYIRERFNDCDDIIYRELETGEDRIKMAFVMIDGMSDKDSISDYTIENLIFSNGLDYLNMDYYKNAIIQHLSKNGLSNVEVKEEADYEKIFNFIMSGDTLMLIDGVDTSLIIGTRTSEKRGVSESVTEAIVRGPRDGFVETLKVNTTLVRKRIKDTNMKIKMYKIGRRSQTDVALIYMDDIVNDKLKEEVKARLEKVDIDGIMDSSMLEYLIEDNYITPFPQIENTERPDSAAASLLEGRVVLIVDNSPFALVIPATVGTFLNSSEDYYNRWMETTIVRFIRTFAAFVTLLAPALYIALTSFHPELLPTKFIYFLAASRINVPFPAVIEASLMELTMELIRQAGTRISGPIGSTIGIVGGLIIGQAAVEAGIVSNLMIIVVAITTIANFAIPSYEFASALRTCKFGFIVLSGLFGLYGIMLGVIVLSSHLILINSFGTPLTAPYTGLGIESGDIKDTLLKVPLQRLWLRPGFTKPKDKQRMKKGGADDGK